jgi:hypothetical protein
MDSLNVTVAPDGDIYCKVKKQTKTGRTTDRTDGKIR